MSKGKNHSEKYVILRDIFDKLDIDLKSSYFNYKNKTVGTEVLEAIQHKVALLKGIPPFGMTPDEETAWRLLHKSQESFVLALELINKVTVPYRIESFCFLFITAWELLMKAKLIREKGRPAITDKDRPENTISFMACLRATFPENAPEFSNLTAIDDLRNEATHLFISGIPLNMMASFQAGVRNYGDFLLNNFKVDIKQRIPEGMMFLIADADIAHSSTNALSKRLSGESLRYIKQWDEMIQDMVHNRIAVDADMSRFLQPVRVQLAFVKNESKADTIQFVSESGMSLAKVHVVKDPDKDYPFFRKTLISTLQSRGVQLTENDVSVILPNVYGIKEETRYCYISKLHRRPQYSHALVDWIVTQQKKNLDFIQDARNRWRSMKSKKP